MEVLAIKSVEDMDSVDTSGPISSSRLAAEIAANGSLG